MTLCGELFAIPASHNSHQPTNGFTNFVHWNAFTIAPAAFVRFIARLVVPNFFQFHVVSEMQKILRTAGQNRVCVCDLFEICLFSFLFNLPGLCNLVLVYEVSSTYMHARISGRLDWWNVWEAICVYIPCEKYLVQFLFAFAALRFLVKNESFLKYIVKSKLASVCVCIYICNMWLRTPQYSIHFAKQFNILLPGVNVENTKTKKKSEAEIKLEANSSVCWYIH